MVLGSSVWSASVFFRHVVNKYICGYYNIHGDAAVLFGGYSDFLSIYGGAIARLLNRHENVNL